MEEVDACLEVHPEDSCSCAEQTVAVVVDLSAVVVFVG